MPQQSAELCPILTLYLHLGFILTLSIVFIHIFCHLRPYILDIGFNVISKLYLDFNGLIVFAALLNVMIF